MQVVPEMIVSTLEEIVVMREHQFTELPSRVDKASLRELAQHVERAQLAILAARIAQLSNGIQALHG